MNTETLVLGGGCFWCTEAVFKMLRGVTGVMPGYAGGKTGREVEPPSYEEVSSGQTGFAEVIKINYDPAQISARDLLTVFFAAHDSTTLNRQGNDIGSQYRSVIFYTTDEQKQVAEKLIAEINLSSREGQPIVTEVRPLGHPPAGGFYAAEDYHQDYYANHAAQPYCQLVINPKLRHVQEEFSSLLKK